MCPLVAILLRDHAFRVIRVGRLAKIKISRRAKIMVLFYCIHTTAFIDTKYSESGFLLETDRLEHYNRTDMY